MNATQLCSHVWINPLEPRIQQTPYAPIIGPLRRQMKPGTVYVCRNCQMICKVPQTASSQAER